MEQQIVRKNGALEDSSSGQVKAFSVNERLDDGLFTFDFPKDTQFSETVADGGRKYYTALGGGGRQEIPEREFGALPDNGSRRTTLRAAVIVFAAAFGMLLAVLYVRRRRREVAIR